MRTKVCIIIVLLLLLGGGRKACAQKHSPNATRQTIRTPKPIDSPGGGKPVYLTPMCIYQGDTIPCIQLRTVYIFRPMKFKNKRQQRRYTKLVRDVKRVLPISKEIQAIVIETYEYLQTLPTKQAKDEHIKRVEKSLKEQYTPRLKRLTFSQGKLLIKLVDRQTDSTGYELVKAFMGPFKAGFYQTFAALFGASLKREYDAEGEDQLTERVILLVESGQI